jgi:hypothetical protein
MCSRCDGQSYEAALADIERIIRQYGWMLQGVEGRRPFTYTIGLAERFGHAELLVRGHLGVGGELLNALGERVRRGARLTHGDRVIERGQEFELRAMPADQLRDHVGMWGNYYLDHHPPPPPLAVLELTPVHGLQSALVRRTRAGRRAAGRQREPVRARRVPNPGRIQPAHP